MPQDQAPPRGTIVVPLCVTIHVNPPPGSLRSVDEWKLMTLERVTTILERGLAASVSSLESVSLLFNPVNPAPGKHRKPRGTDV